MIRCLLKFSDLFLRKKRGIWGGNLLLKGLSVLLAQNTLFHPQIHRQTWHSSFSSKEEKVWKVIHVRSCPPLNEHSRRDLKEGFLAVNRGVPSAGKQPTPTWLQYPWRVDEERSNHKAVNLQTEAEMGEQDRDLEKDLKYAVFVQLKNTHSNPPPYWAS